MLELTCFPRSEEALTKARKFLTKAEKFSGKFNVFRLKRFMLEPERDVNASLQVMTGSIHNLPASVHNLHKRDRVKLFDLLASIPFKLASIRRILLSLVDDRVKLRLKLLCLDAITSNFLRNFFAKTQSRRTLHGTSLHRRDQVVIVGGHNSTERYRARYC